MRPLTVGLFEAVFFRNLQADDIALPWVSIAGFADVLALMSVASWLAVRHERRALSTPSTPRIRRLT